MIESKFNTPSKFTGEIMGTKVAVEYNHSTIDFDEVIDAFNTIMTGLGYHPDAIKEWIVDRAAEYNEGDIQIEYNEWDVTLEDGLEDESPWPINGDPIQNIIDILKGMEIDGEMMQYIIEQVGLDEQMAIQLATKFPKTVVDHIYEMEMEGPEFDSAGFNHNDNNPPFVSDNFQIGPKGAYEHEDQIDEDNVFANTFHNYIKTMKATKNKK